MCQHFDNLNTQLFSTFKKGRMYLKTCTNTLNSSEYNYLQGTSYSNHSEINCIIDFINNYCDKGDILNGKYILWN